MNSKYNFQYFKGILFPIWAGFADFEIKGFDLTGGSSFKTLRNILVKGLNNQMEDEKAELFEIKIKNDTSICYISKAVKIT